MKVKLPEPKRKVRKKRKLRVKVGLTTQKVMIRRYCTISVKDQRTTIYMHGTFPGSVLLTEVKSESVVNLSTKRKLSKPK